MFHLVFFSVQEMYILEFSGYFILQCFENEFMLEWMEFKNVQTFIICSYARSEALLNLFMEHKQVRCSMWNVWQVTYGFVYTCCKWGSMLCLPGDKVIPLFLLQCGECRFCKSPKTNRCEEAMWVHISCHLIQFSCAFTHCTFLQTRYKCYESIQTTRLFIN